MHRIILGSVAVLLAAAPAGRAAEDEARALLSEESFWRFHVAWRPPTAIADAPGKAAVLPVKVAYRSYPGLEQLSTPPPPAAWTKADFDDSAWPQARAAGQRTGSVDEAVAGPGIRFSTSLLSLRGTFLVSDPSAVADLRLAMAFRGGAVVYLNGREIARKHLPAGELLAATPAEPYPPEAYLDAKGKCIPGAYHAAKRVKAGEKDLAARIASRERRLAGVAVPPGLLRKGVNVLAVQLRRSDYHDSARRWFREPNFQRRPAWVPVGLTEVRLTASGTGASPNVARPRGLQVWNHDVNDRVCVLDYGSPCDTLRAISLVAPRNAAASGQVVVGCDEALRNVRAKPGELKATHGGHTIPAERVRIRYGHLDGRAYHRPDWFDGLADQPPAVAPVHAAGGGAVLPIWATVRAGRETPAGEYRGRLTISADGADDVAVPIRLRVADWLLPDPKDFRTYVGVYESPTSLALQYGVDEWSPRHWQLMARAFELLARVGNKIVNVPLVNRTQFGNDEGMVYWIKRPDGSFDHDFRVFDRYLALVSKHLGRPDFVALQVWHSGGWQTRQADQQNTVTLLDKATGKHTRMRVPTFGTAESKRFWKPVLDAIRKRLAAAGMDGAMCLGILSDGTAPPEVFKAFDEIVPGQAKWTRGCHRSTRETSPYALKGGGRVVCHEFCYGMAMADPAKGLPPIWKQRAWPGVAFIRHNFDDTMSLLKYRTMAERALYCGTRGVGRIGLDYWNVAKDARGRPANIYNRWPHSSCAQRSPNLYRLSWAAPQGPAATVRFEQFRQGLQEAEAMIVLGEALATAADRLGSELADECRRVFVDRMNYCRLRCPEAYGRVYLRTNHAGWEELSARLYAAAAKVAAKLAPGR